jgi:hypothetical protein
MSKMAATSNSMVSSNGDQWQWSCSVLKRVGNARLQERNVKHWVASHRFWKFQFIGNWIDASGNLEWTKLLIIQFGRGACAFEIEAIQEILITDF